MVKPNMNKLLEMFLLCHGFSDVKNLAEKIVFFAQVILNEVCMCSYDEFTVDRRILIVVLCICRCIDKFSTKKFVFSCLRRC